MPSADLSGYPGPGAVNAYRCGSCGGLTVTRHVDHGVTPIFLACRATDDCEGRAVSGGYRVPAGQLPDPEWEWYRPTGKALRRLSFPMQEHIKAGGLALRAVHAEDAR